MARGFDKSEEIRTYRAMISFRQSEIVAMARATGRVAVEDLALRFGVTVQTIRRDLEALCGAGQLDRVHGGAVARGGVANIEYGARARMAARAKAAIAARCAVEIPDNSSLILTLGTTTEAVARALLHHRNLTVVTNNMNVANILADNPGCEVIVAGGALRRSDGGLVGELTVQFLRQFKVDLAVIGASAVDSDGDLLDYDLAEVRVSRAILDTARAAWLVADASKFARVAPVRLAGLGELAAVFTDADLPGDLAARCAQWGTKVVTDAA